MHHRFRRCQPALARGSSCKHCLSRVRFCRYIISQHFGSDHRAQRVTARILEVPVGKMDVDAMAAIHKERKSITAGQMIKAIVPIDPSSLSDGGLQMKQALEGWDGDMQPELTAPTVFAAVIESLTEIVSELLCCTACTRNLVHGSRSLQCPVLSRQHAIVIRVPSVSIRPFSSFH
jgi:hypothetical protein